MIIVEAVDECDLECPTCIAASSRGAGNIRDRTSLVARVRRYADIHGKPPLLMVSGGEPTLHPEILELLNDLGMHCEQLMLITNGVKLAEDEGFAKRLGELGPRFQVYLQFDSLRSEALVHLRGADYRHVREKALANLGKHHVACTLVCVVKRGVNDAEVAEIVRYAVNHSTVRGVTFQPIRASGRHVSFQHGDHSITLSEVRRRLLGDLRLPESSLVPHPTNPERICIGYLGCEPPVLEPLTAVIYGSADVSLSQHLYPPPDAVSQALPERQWLRVAIISFLDVHDFTSQAARQSGVHFLEAQGDLVALDEKFLAKAEPTSIPVTITRGSRVPR